MSIFESEPNILERMIVAVEKVKNRLLRAARALNEAGIPYAVVGGNAVAAWAASVDEAAVRNTQDVDILLRRADLDLAAVALEKVGFVHHYTSGVDLFLDGPGASPRDAIHVVFAGEKVMSHYETPAPDAEESEMLGQNVRFLSLESLVRMKLTSFRLKDRVHLLDLINLGLVDEKMLSKIPPALAERLRELLDHPDA